MADGIVGNGWLISGSFTQGGTLTDPGVTPVFTVTDPSNPPVVTTPTPTHGGTGLYSATVVCNVAGTWEAVISVPSPNAGYGAAKIGWTVAPA